MSRVQRIDRSEVLRAPETTQEGYLRLEGKLARTGIQVYRRADGTEIREYRPPDSVFDAAYLDSFDGIPLTNTHPSSLLDATTASRHAVGAVAGARKLDEKWVGGALTIWDADAIASVKGGRAQLSVGYSAEVVDEAGEIDGERYDAVQKNIVANHLALVDAARAGSECRVRLDDDGNAVLIGPENEAKIDSLTQEPRKMPHKLKLDGLEIEVGDANAQAIIEKAIATARSERADELMALQASLAAAEAKAKQDAERFHDLEASIPARAAELAEVMDCARKHLGENFKLDGGPLAWKRGVIKKALPKLDGADALEGVALEHTWKSALAVLAAEPTDVEKVRSVQSPPSSAHQDSDPEAARRRMIERINASFVK